MVQRILYGETSRQLRHVPHGDVTAATFVVEDLHRSLGTAEREITSGAATRLSASLSLTSTGLAGAGEADASRVPVGSTVGVEVDLPCLIIAPDGSYEAFRVQALSAGAYITADRELTGLYPIGSAVKGAELYAAIPDSIDREDDLMEHGAALRVVWTYDLQGKRYKVQEQVRIVRSDQPGDLQIARVEEFCIHMFPDFKDRLPRTDPGMLRKWIGVATRMVTAEFRRRGLQPERSLSGDDMVMAVAFQTMLIAAQNSACPASMPAQDFIDLMRAELRNVMGAMLTGEPGEDTADVNRATDTAEGRRSRRYAGAIQPL